MSITSFARWRRITHDNVWLLAALLLAILSFIVLKQANPTFVQAIGMENGQGRPLTVQPYSVRTGKDGRGMLRLWLRYSRDQNATFIIEPDNNFYTYPKVPLKRRCIDHIWLRPPMFGNKVSPMPESINKAPICRETALDFSPYLREGLNPFVLMVHADNAPAVSLYISPQLFGARIFSTLACLGLFAAAAIVLFRIARRAGLDPATSCTAIAGMAYYALWLHYRPNLSYTPDLPGHIPYIQYMAQNWLINPYNYSGGENVQPPLFYFLAGRVFNLFSASGVINPLLAVRVFSLGLYMTFCLYGLRTLHEAVERKGLPYYAGNLLIMFWPVAINTATNISNDIALYSAWGAAFYYLARWFKEHSLGCLQLAIGLTGMAFMIKANAWVIGGITGSCVLYALSTGRLSWRQLWQGKTLVAWGVMALGMAVSAGRIIYMWLLHGADASRGYFGGARNDIYPSHYFIYFSFSDFAAHPFATFKNEPSFLNYFLKTLLYSPFNALPPPFPWLPAMLNVALIIWLLVVICGTIVYLMQKQDSFNSVCPHMIGTVVSIAGIITFTIFDHYEHTQNFRFILPMLVPLVVLFARGMETTRTIRTMQPFYWLGLAAGISLTAGAAILYLAQY